MASTHFTTGTTITSEWLNDVNDAVYNSTITAEGVQYTPPFTGAVTTNVENKLAETVSVKDFGAVGDGVTDDTDAIQNALDSGAKLITFPKGVYVSGPLVLPDWIEIQGETFPESIGSGLGPVTLKFNLTSGTAITCGNNPVIKNIAFQNVGGSYNDTTDSLSGTSAICIQTNNDVNIEQCSFSFWYVCVNIGGGPYYCNSNNVWFNRCTYGYLSNTTQPYNFNIFAPHSSKVDIFFAGTSTYYPRNIKVFGGSIEGYSNVATHFLDICFFGTYFETLASKSGAYAIEPITSSGSVSLYGCVVYMNYTARFVNMSGLTDCMLTSVGNVFTGVAPTNSVIYYLPDNGSVHLAGDKFESTFDSTCSYAAPQAYIGNFNISMPRLPAGNTEVSYTHAFSCGPQGMYMNGLTSAPTNKLVGMMVLADGISWDPLSRAAGRPYWTVWQGDRWYSISG